MQSYKLIVLLYWLYRNVLNTGNSNVNKVVRPVLSCSCCMFQSIPNSRKKTKLAYLSSLSLIPELAFGRWMWQGHPQFQGHPQLYIKFKVRLATQHSNKKFDNCFTIKMNYSYLKVAGWQTMNTECTCKNIIISILLREM